ncbi:MAG: hypothetical protein U9N44_02710 [Chloroflexota bacterium]|nr:hypothetical protein [Chloroflexota bacterium]
MNPRYYLLEAFDDFSAADTNKDYEISFEEIFAYASPKTVSYVEAYDEVQEPQIDDQYEEDFGIFYVAILNTNLHITSLTVNGVDYESGDLPVTFKWMPGSSHDFEAPSSVPVTTGTQYQFTSWSDGNVSSSRTISGGGEYTANYVTQHYLTIESEHGGPSGEGWYYDGTNASIYVPSPIGAIVRKVCTGWSGDINSSTSQATVYMDRPMAVVATWRNDYSQLYMLIGGIIGVTAIGAGFFIRRRRRRNRVPVAVDVGSSVDPGDDQQAADVEPSAAIE